MKTISFLMSLFFTMSCMTLAYSASPKPATLNLTATGRQSTVINGVGNSVKNNYITTVNKSTVINNHKITNDYRQYATHNNTYESQDISIQEQELERQYIQLKSQRHQYNNLNYGYNLENIAIAYSELEKKEKARPIYWEAESYLLALGVEHHDYGNLMLNLANTYENPLEQRKYYELAYPALYKLSAEYQNRNRSDLGYVYCMQQVTDHEDYASLMMNIGTTYDDPKERRKYYELAIPGIKALGESSPKFANLMLNIGNTYDDPKEQRIYYELAIPGLSKLPLDHPHFGNLMKALGDTYFNEKNYLQALDYYTKAEAGRMNQSNYSYLMIATGSAYRELHQAKPALSAYRKALAHAIKFQQKDSMSCAKIQTAQLYERELHQSAIAKRLYMQVQDLTCKEKDCFVCGRLKALANVTPASEAEVARIWTEPTP